MNFLDCPSLAEIEQDEGPPPATPADALFTTTQRRLLGFLYGQPDREFQTGELIEITGSGDGAVRREIRKLREANLVRAWRSGGCSFLQANRNCPIYPELAAIVRNSFGLAGPLRAALGPIAGYVELVFVFEPFDHGTSKCAPLELLVVSNSLHAAAEGVDFAMEVAQHRLRRGLVALVVEPTELKNPRRFLERALAQPRTWVFGDERRLAAITSGP